MKVMQLSVTVIQDDEKQSDLDIVQDMELIKRRMEELLEEYQELKHCSRFIIKEVE